MNVMHSYPVTSETGTLCGLDSFLADSGRRGFRYGLATNPSAITHDGVPAWRAFMQNGLGPACFFGPEHGFRGAASDAVEVEDEVFRGIPAYSLYGKRLKPEPHMFNGLDAIVFDMQDVGCRYYTYLYTLAYLMEACEKASLPLIVLDRPNPIGGTIVEGSPIPRQEWSFVGGYGLPPRYGMTIGEFARYLQGEYYPRTDLEVVPLKGWEERQTWDRTGLPWPLPSPSLPTLSAATVYAGTCLVEGTWLSEGRGTARPFEIIGAPFIDGESLREALADLGLPGIVFISLFFTPTASKFKDERCEGILVSVIDQQAVRALDTGISIIHTIQRLYPDSFKWREDWDSPMISFFDRLAGGKGLRQMIDAGAPLNECIAFAHEGEEKFLKIRAPYLMYGSTR